MAVAPSRRSSPLSRHEIVEVALRLARDQGVDAVTMRSVAAELEVTPMALYYHVKNKDDLLGLLAAAVIAEQSDLPSDLGDTTWEEALNSFLTSLWTTLRAYRGLDEHLIALPDLGMSPDVYHGGIEFLERAGFPPRLARLAWPCAITYVHGRLSVDANLDREAARAMGLSDISAKKHLAFGVETVIAGLQAMLDRAQHESGK